MADSDYKVQVSRTEAANTASNVIYTQLADNAGNVATITGGKLDVNASVTLETAYVDDSAFVIGVDKVNAQGFLADETATDSVDEGDIGLARMTLDRRMITASQQDGTWNIATVTTLTGITNDVNIADGGNSITIDNSTLAVVGGGTEATALRVTIANDSTGVLSIDDNGGSLTVDGTVAVSSVAGTVTVTATDLDIRDLTHVSDSVQIGDGTDLLAVNADGSINVVVAGTSGTPVHDYDHAVNTGTGASSNHDYTVVGTVFNCSGVSVSSSGKGRYEIQFGPIASLATVLVGFLDADETKWIPFDPALAVLATGTGTLRVIKENRQASSTDFYSTIMGSDVA